MANSALAERREISISGFSRLKRLPDGRLAPVRTVHGKSRTRLYNIWCGIIGRCYNSKLPTYKHYGGRGILMCDEWRSSSSAFIEWAETHGYREDLTIDRKDNNGPYSPDNCRWTTKHMQGRNTRSNRNLTHQGRSMCLSAWAEELGISVSALSTRVKVGMVGDRLFSKERLKTGPK